MGCAASAGARDPSCDHHGRRYCEAAEADHPALETADVELHVAATGPSAEENGDEAAAAQLEALEADWDMQSAGSVGEEPSEASLAFRRLRITAAARVLHGVNGDPEQFEVDQWGGACGRQGTDAVTEQWVQSTASLPPPDRGGDSTASLALPEPRRGSAAPLNMSAVAIDACAESPKHADAPLGHLSDGALSPILVLRRRLSSAVPAAAAADRMHVEDAESVIVVPPLEEGTNSSTGQSGSGSRNRSCDANSSDCSRNRSNSSRAM